MAITAYDPAWDRDRRMRQVALDAVNAIVPRSTSSDDAPRPFRVAAPDLALGCTFLLTWIAPQLLGRARRRMPRS